MSGEAIKLFRSHDGCLVEARLVEGMRPADLSAVDRSWAPYRNQLASSLRARGIPRQQWPESLHWDWSKKTPVLQTLANTVWGITCAGEWQAVMLVDSVTYQARLESDRGKPLIYVDYLEIAPWNWKHQHIEDERRYKGVGSILMRVAMRQSVAEGFHGRVGLHSLPQSEGFYEGACGMARLDADPRKDDLVYFELSRDEAQRRLEREE